MLENVFAIVKFYDGYHRSCDHDWEQHCKVRPETDGVVKSAVDPWQEKQVAEEQPSVQEGKSGYKKTRLRLALAINISTITYRIRKLFVHFHATLGTITFNARDFFATVSVRSWTQTDMVALRHQIQSPVKTRERHIKNTCVGESRGKSFPL